MIQLQNKRIQKKLLALLAISLLVVTASCSDSNQSTTTVFTNVNGYSFDNTRELEKFTTLVIDSGKVMAIGDDRLVENFSDAIIIDLTSSVKKPKIEALKEFKSSNWRKRNK